MLVCRAKSAQTPYQFWDLIDPAGRQSPLAFSSAVNELIRHCMVSVLGTCQEEHIFWRELLCSGRTTIQTAHIEVKIA